MDWKKRLNEQNERLFKFPDGWWTSEEIAVQVGCSPERVREHFSPSIKDGTIEVKQHIVWNPRLERKEHKWGFRPRNVASQKLSTVSPSHRETQDNLTGREILGIDKKAANGRRMGKCIADYGDRIKVTWQSGITTTPSKRGFIKGGLRLA